MTSHCQDKYGRRRGSAPTKRRCLTWILWDDITWDTDKDRQNRVKHGVPFTEAETVVEDPFVAVVPDTAHSTHEERFQMVGMASSGRLLLVIAAIGPRGTLRLISARRPTRRERHAYESS